MSKSCVNCLHLSASMTSGWASLRAMITPMSSSGSSTPLLSASRLLKCLLAACWNSMPVTCSTSQLGRKGMIVHRRSLSASIILRNSWKELSSILACCTSPLPASDSRKPTTITNWTRAVNSSRQTTPSSFVSNIWANFLAWSEPMDACVAEVRCTMTGSKSSGLSAPLPLTSRPLKLLLHSSVSSWLSSNLRRSSGRKGRTTAMLLLAACIVMRRVSTLPRLQAVPRVDSRTVLLWRPRSCAGIVAFSGPAGFFCCVAAEVLERARHSSTKECGSTGRLTSSPCRISWKVRTRS
mmetsp:Transcript_59496/g.191437  ORF Transcript_59496/g.191437 Transcript_59496/m.191437 type:complete len:295 (-) Transcript_59496:382-1266(-)